MNHKKYFWIIVAMAFIATALSFLDRQVLSILIIKIKQELTISDVQYGFINSGFLVGYAIMFTVGGILIDRYGSRLGLAVSVGLWSLATALHSLANSVMHFGAFRFLLGVGEGGAFPGAIKAVIEWVPKNKQALANGIAIGGAALGAVIAPPLCVYLINVTGWRGVFIITSIIGFTWVLVWLSANIEQIGKLFWIPFLALGVSNMLGGWISDTVFSKTNNLNLARKTIMGAAALLMFPVLFVKFAPSPELVILIMCIAFFAHGLWITNFITSIGDTFGRTVTSTVVGLSGTDGAISAFVFLYIAHRHRSIRPAVGSGKTLPFARLPDTM